MRKLLWVPAILGIGLFFRNQGKVADLIDTGDWSHALIYIAFGVGGAACGVLAMSGSEPSAQTDPEPTEAAQQNPAESLQSYNPVEIGKSYLILEEILSDWHSRPGLPLAADQKEYLRHIAHSMREDLTKEEWLKIVTLIADDPKADLREYCKKG